MLNKFMIGCCYYPEHWDRADMKRDLERIKDLGLNCIRMGEFSWSMYEKEEGKYDFSLLQEAVEYADELGIDVILGTPTAAPPKWLIDKYPEVLCTNAKQMVMHHGSRQHHNHTSEIYLKYCAAITEAMVKAFCGYRNVIGWQIDNEINCHRNESYSESDDKAFRAWLEKKYGTIEKLNEAWGNRFWSLEFNSFSQVSTPKPTTTYENPSWKTDYYLFLSDTVINYASVQTKIIRKYMPNAFITHNGEFGNINYTDMMKECIDIMSFDSYPAFQEKNGKSFGRYASYRLAKTRGISEQFLILEQQAGPGGQLSYLLPTPRPNQIRLWTYQSIAHGAIGVLYFRYRTALYGAEQLWYGIYDHDTEENYRSREVRKITEELSRVGDIFLKARKPREIAIFRDYHNVCVDKIETFAKDDSWHIFMALNRENVHADIISTADALDKYKVVIFPHITIVDDELSEKIKRFTENGGIAMISARSGVKDKNAHYRPTKAPCAFRELAGCRVDWFTSMPAYEAQSVEMNGETYTVQDYYEMLESEGGEVIATYTDGFCKDKAGIVKNGNTYYIGFYCKDSAHMYLDLIKDYITHTPPVDRDLECIDLGEHLMYLNHSDRKIELSGYDLLTEKDFDSVEEYGVVLVKK